MVKKIDIEKMEDKVKQMGFPSVVHNFGHLKRTAEGAKWFVKITNGSKKQQELAYIAGLIHDLERPLTEKKDHTHDSIREAKKFLNGFQIKSEDKDKILYLIGKHREAKDNNTFKQAVFLADKILEQMGSYNCLRRCTFVGEIEDYKGIPFEKAIIRQFKWRMKKYNPSVFLKRFEELVKYQYNWQVIFFDALKKDKDWAIKFGKSAYNNGKSHKMSLEEFFEQYKSIGKVDKKFKQEALDYINGKKWKQFEGMIK